MDVNDFFLDTHELETLACMEQYPDLFDVLDLQDESAKRSGREEVSVAQSLLQLPVAAAEEPRAVEPPAKKSKKSGAAAKDSRKVYLEEHVQTLVATNRELVQEMRLLEREAAVLQEHLAQLHQAQARVRVARKLEAAKLPLSLPPFSPTILSRSDVA